MRPDSLPGEGLRWPDGCLFYHRSQGPITPKQWTRIAQCGVVIKKGAFDAEELRCIQRNWTEYADKHELPYDAAYEYAGGYSKEKQAEGSRLHFIHVLQKTNFNAHMCRGMDNRTGIQVITKMRAIYRPHADDGTHCSRGGRIFVDWPPERVAQLKELHKRGYTLKQMQTTMGIYYKTIEYQMKRMGLGEDDKLDAPPKLLSPNKLAFFFRLLTTAVTGSYRSFGDLLRTPIELATAADFEERTGRINFRNIALRLNITGKQAEAIWRNEAAKLRAVYEECGGDADKVIDKYNLPWRRMTGREWQQMLSIIREQNAPTPYSLDRQTIHKRMMEEGLRGFYTCEGKKEGSMAVKQVQTVIRQIKEQCRDVNGGLDFEPINALSFNDLLDIIAQYKMTTIWETRGKQRYMRGGIQKVLMTRLVVSKLEQLGWRRCDIPNYEAMWNGPGDSSQECRLDDGEDGDSDDSEGGEFDVYTRNVKEELMTHNGCGITVPGQGSEQEQDELAVGAIPEEASRDTASSEMRCENGQDWSSAGEGEGSQESRRTPQREGDPRVGDALKVKAEPVSPCDQRQRVVNGDGFITEEDKTERKRQKKLRKERRRLEREAVAESRRTPQREGEWTVSETLRRLKSESLSPGNSRHELTTKEVNGCSVLVEGSKTRAVEWNGETGQREEESWIAEDEAERKREKKLRKERRRLEREQMAAGCGPVKCEVNEESTSAVGGGSEVTEGVKSRKRHRVNTESDAEGRERKRHRSEQEQTVKTETLDKEERKRLNKLRKEERRLERECCAGNMEEVVSYAPPRESGKTLEEHERTVIEESGWDVEEETPRMRVKRLKKEIKRLERESCPTEGVDGEGADSEWERKRQKRLKKMYKKLEKLRQESSA